MRALLVVALGLALTGCEFGEKKDEGVCLDIARLIVADPDSIKVNSMDRYQSNVGVGALRSYYDLEFKGDTAPAVKRMLDLYEKEGMEVIETMLSYDLTFDGRSGKMRETMMCRYLTYRNKTILDYFAFGSQPVSSPSFFDFFLMRKRPEGLDHSFQLK